mmetsp:Transcript_14698/g.16814  ORF Transcript_14698/g.16814 Transcript_14698/m.16814 type:complete len:195 (-) Transcript_14698:166-750(-)|eukprot:CAMPEP_0194185888 /NCGR_PEP_ID=MMETSP0154-20130528/44678_1 /TAXON_ID=1049557 /ORGANISM="Thalassiothrix antarctica, Strain L6-D1" /LENGTH=194 /DNA_ID=CAMNT_0038904555 /DNA_START=49 /DNA_END=633 /DNA_ORIENTATION=+
MTASTRSSPLKVTTADSKSDMPSKLHQDVDGKKDSTANVSAPAKNGNTKVSKKRPSPPSKKTKNKKIALEDTVDKAATSEKDQDSKIEDADETKASNVNLFQNENEDSNQDTTDVAECIKKDDSKEETLNKDKEATTSSNDDQSKEEDQSEKDDTKEEEVKESPDISAVAKDEGESNPTDNSISKTSKEEQSKD